MKRVFGGLVLAFLMLGVAGGARAVAAVFYTLNPTTGSFEEGASFSVLLGASTGTEEVIALDVVGSFDATKLELETIAKVDASTIYSFVSYDATLVQIDNNAGTFTVVLTPTGSIHEGQAIDEAFLRLNFKAKAAGTASVNFTCEEGSIMESNLINQSAVDIVECTSNQSGSYTITAGSEAVATATPVPTTAAGATAAPTTAAAELPETAGGAATTVGLAIFGALSVLGAFMLRWL